MSRSLVELDIEDNEIGAEGCGAIAFSLKKDGVCLKSLSLSQNCVTEEGGIELCQALEKNKSLRELKLAANGLGHQFGKALSG